MSLMQEYEDIRNFLGHKKYDAMCKYIEIFGNYKEYDKGVKEIRNIKDINEWQKAMDKLHEKYKPIFIEDVAMNKEEWEKFEKWYAENKQKTKNYKERGAR